MDQEFVGVDVSKDRLDMAVYSTNQTLSFTNNEDGISLAITWLKKLNPAITLMEATGGLEVPLYVALQEAGLPVSVKNPRQMRDFAKSLGILVKTDKVDARVLARYAATVQPEVRPLPDEESRQLNIQVTRRRQLVEMIIAESNRLKSVPDKVMKERIQSHIDWLRAELDDIDKGISQMVRDNPIWQDKNRLLESVPGVGPVLSSTLIAELPELGNLNRKKIATLVGVSPLNRDSGKYRGERSIWGGRCRVRRPLYMATLVAIRHNPVIRSFYEKLLKSGKTKKVALTACMRKLLVTLNAMLKHKSSWSNGYSNIIDTRNPVTQTVA